MNKIENVLIINLDRRKDLLNRIKYIFDFFNSIDEINITRIQGNDFIDKCKNNPKEFNNLIETEIISLNANGLRRSKNAVLGEIGCYLSHKKCWEKIINEKLENTLILEDGIIFHEHLFNPIINMKISYDIIFVNKEMVKQDDNLVGYGLQGYILSYEGATKLNNLCKSLYLPIDLQVRQVCNEKKLHAKVSRIKFVERNDDRSSSISDKIEDPNNLNEKQSMDPIYLRIIKNMISKNISLQDYI